MKTLANISKTKKSKLVKADGELKQRFVDALNYIKGEDHRKAHCGYYTGSGRYIRFTSYYYEIKTTLEAFGFKSKDGNDAPRGGQQGDYINMSKQAYTTLMNLIN